MATIGTRHERLLGREGTGLIIIDVQEAFRPVIHGFDEVAAQCGLLAEGFGVLGRPVLATEQYPERLGQTVSEVAERLPEGVAPIPKLRFSACGVEGFDAALSDAGCRTWLLAGIETHVCVNQTAHDLARWGHTVHVAADAVSSRTERNRDLGLAKMAAAGAITTSAEMALFEMLEVAGSDEFKAISRLVR